MPATFTNLRFHIIFSTKYRKPLIRENIRGLLYSYIGGIITNERATLISAGGVADHVHLLARLHPDNSISQLLRTIKANSSKWLKEEHLGGLWPGWQTGYSAFTVSRSLTGRMEHYIQHQEQHHTKETYRQELLRLLRRHDFEVDDAMLDRED